MSLGARNQKKNHCLFDLKNLPFLCMKLLGPAFKKTKLQSSLKSKIRTGFLKFEGFSFGLYVKYSFIWSIVTLNI